MRHLAAEGRKIRTPPPLYVFDTFPYDNYKLGALIMPPLIDHSVEIILNNNYLEITSVLITLRSYSCFKY